MNMNVGKHGHEHNPLSGEEQHIREHINAIEIPDEGLSEFDELDMFVEEVWPELVGTYSEKDQSMVNILNVIRHGWYIVGLPHFECEQIVVHDPVEGGYHVDTFWDEEVNHVNVKELDEFLAEEEAIKLHIDGLLYELVKAKAMKKAILEYEANQSKSSEEK